MMVSHFFPFGVGAGDSLDQFPGFRGLLGGRSPAGLLSAFRRRPFSLRTKGECCWS